MKYLRALIFILILVLIGIGVYFVYIKLKPANVKRSTTTQETPRPFENVNQTGATKVVSKFSDYTTSEAVKLGKSIEVKGRFQSSDSPNQELNGIVYSKVIGILEDSGSLSKVWLTTSEYEQISSIVSTNVRIGEPVTLILEASGAVNFTTPFESTKN